jgi:hypothetical protein
MKIPLLKVSIKILKILKIKYIIKNIIKDKKIKIQRKKSTLLTKIIDTKKIMIITAEKMRTN